MKQDTRLTAAERAAMEARVAALRLEAKKLNATLKADAQAANVEEAKETEQLSIEAEEVIEEVTETPTEEEEVTEEVTETPAEEEDVTEEVTETPTEEEEVAEEVTETPAEEEEVTEEVTETPTEEDEVTEEVTETPAEEEDVTEEVTETPTEEEEVAEEVTETPAQEEEVAEEVTETPAQEEEVTEEVTETSTENAENQDENEDDTVGIAKIFKWLFGIVGVAALVGILIMLMLMHFGKDNNQLPDGGPVNPDNGVVDTTPGGDEVPGTTDQTNPVDPKFDMDAFTESVKNIAKELTSDDNIATNVDIFIGKIGEDKLVELVGEHGELSVQKAIAEFLAFVPEIKMNQYISNNGLDYNLKAKNDWYNKLDEAEAAYKEATGKNPEGAFMSLEGYDTFKNNREVMRQLIIESGDSALLIWYEAKTDGYDVMVKQERDTENAHAYKEEVKLELVNNVNGSVKLIELQLEQKVNGTDADTLTYADAYAEFIINNYMYVVAN